MKPFFLSFLVALISNGLSAQNYYEISFEGTGLYESDTRHELVVEPNGLWQVGSPDKTVFTEAFTLPNAIVTDTANSYPINANSSFMIKHVADLGFAMPNFVSFSGVYRVDSDSLSDYGMIEFSPDNGTTWVDLVDQGQYDAMIHWGNMGIESQVPVLTGNSNGWKNFSVLFLQLELFFSIEVGDTVLFKFSFISDAIDNNRDGLMFDSLRIEDTPPVNVIEQELESSLRIYPNPANSILTIDYSNVEDDELTIEIYNHLGVKVEKLQQNEQWNKKVDVSHYANGFYYIVLSNCQGNNRQSGVFVKQTN
ncbi:MAG: T9SS type A sorting domain-containing protein [Fluviicola sp.]|nr:T9SS type A sorting domain-containing protein [Fluviicola sp.]